MFEYVNPYTEVWGIHFYNKSCDMEINIFESTPRFLGHTNDHCSKLEYQELNVDLVVSDAVLNPYLIFPSIPGKTIQTRITLFPDIRLYLRFSDILELFRIIAECI